MRELSLFSGAGGGLLGSIILGWQPVQFVEHDAYCQRILAARFPDVPRHGDVRDFHPVPDSCDIVTGGFPCQPFSQAGKRLGEDDPRNMWPHAVRVLVESGAPLGFFENVPGLLSSGYFGTVLGDLAEAGFDAEWCVLGADDVGAPHRRKRLWILAYRDGIRLEDVPATRPASGETSGSWRREDAVERSQERHGDSGSPWWCDPADVCDPASGGQSVCRPPSQSRDERHAVRADGDGHEGDPWLAAPYVGRVATGVASRVDRLRALGNGQVPQTMAVAFTILSEAAGLYEEGR